MPNWGEHFLVRFFGLGTLLSVLFWVLFWVDRVHRVGDGLVGRAPYRFKQSSSSQRVVVVCQQWRRRRVQCCHVLVLHEDMPNWWWWRHTDEKWYYCPLKFRNLPGTCSGGWSLLPATGTLLCGRTKTATLGKNVAADGGSGERPLFTLTHKRPRRGHRGFWPTRKALCAPLPAKIRRQFCSKQSSLLSRNVSSLSLFQFALVCVRECTRESLLLLLLPSLPPFQLKVFGFLLTSSD